MTLRVWMAAALLTAGNAAQAQAPGAAAAPGVAASAPAPATAPARIPDPPVGPPAVWVPNDTPQGTGPWPAVMEPAPGLPTHTLYRPARLDTLGNTRLPIVVWANGACVNVGNRFRPFLTEIASHGYLVLALGPIGPKEAEAGQGSSNFRGPPAAGSPAALAAARGEVPAPNAGSSRPSDTYPAQMLHAVDWAQAEASRAGSALAGRIDTQAVAVMGQSCDGIQALDAARDKRVKTVGVWNSGLFSDDSRPLAIAGANITKATLKTLHTPAIYITGVPTEVAFKNADDDVDRINTVPVFRAWLEGTGHSGTYREANGGAYSPVAVAWLNWQLKGDTRAALHFKGVDCHLCRNPRWHVRQKGLAE